MWQYFIVYGCSFTRLFVQSIKLITSQNSLILAQLTQTFYGFFTDTWSYVAMLE